MPPHDDTRERILEVAGPIFAERGFHATSIREISSNAGVNLAAVNYHFRSKENLYLETVKFAYESIAAKEPLPADTGDMPPQAQLRAFIRAMLKRLVTKPCPEWHGNLIMREVSQPTEACKEFVKNFVQPTFRLLQQVIASLLPLGLPGERHILIGFSIMGQILHYHHARYVIPMLIGESAYQSFDLDRIADHITTFTLAALESLHPHRCEGART